MSNISPNDRFQRNITVWEKGELLGCGSFGSVYEGISGDGFFFAIKEVSLLDQESRGSESISQLEQEIGLLSGFEHENIVQYYGTEKMLTRQIPYSHLECMQALYRIGKGEPPPVPDFLSNNARDFILQCLQVNPNNRPTAAQLLHHSFVRS
ncbi:hypothetical protein SLEP1_g11516 [Rubroshorea leprosula]|uniref:mitogen-activated protein kinase kinase kinase n=1 Tax=Rubroshorea leprosula TaxID=152421 RepID=A0AAV5IK39_9ROSI|nr:hypothetical protein SLEP1_g11516 [Rubroshorea leprosula]